MLWDMFVSQIRTRALRLISQNTSITVTIQANIVNEIIKIRNILSYVSFSRTVEESS